jgi:hypothetical protein
VVPAILAMQQDIGKQMTALRRSLGAQSRHRGMTLGIGGLGLAILALFAATLGNTILTGAMAGPFAALGAGMAPALGVFVLGAAAVCLLAWVIAMLAHALSRRAAG